MATRLEFWFSYGSVYTYLTVRRISEVAKKYVNVEVLWRPYNLTTVFANKGIQGGPFANRPEKLRYMWRDVERRAARYGFPYRKPEVYPVNAQSTVRVGYLAQMEGWCEYFTRRVFDMNFVEGRPIGAPGSLEAALKDIGKTPEVTIAQAHEPANEAALVAQTADAERAGMFGSPHFVVEGDLFWGDDRLEDAMEAASAAARS